MGVLKARLPAEEHDDEARERARRAEADVDRLLGDKALFQVPDVQRYGGPSPPVIWRAAHEGLIELLQVSNRTRLSRATMKRILLEGLPPVTFVYGKRGAA